MKVPLILGVEGEAKTLFIDEGKAGLFYEPENEKAMAEAIQFILDKPELIAQMGENGREYVMQKFNRNSLAENFFKKLNQLK